MTRIKISAVWSLLVCVFLMPALSLAELTIEITRGNERGVPIAVIPFAWSGAGILPEDLAGIVGSDLRLSGQFAPIPSSRFLGLPSQAKDVFFGDWRRIGASYLVLGKVAGQPGGMYRVDYELIDVEAKQSVLRGEVIGDVHQLRSLAHYISDDVYRKITGVPGIFSTRIVYVVAKRHSVDRTDYQLVYADIDGRRATPVLSSKEPILAPSWSPDGRRLAYVSYETGRPAIYVHTLATGKRERVSSFKGLNIAPKWSPDGNSLALVLSKTGNADIHILDLKTSRLRQVTRHFALDNEPEWTPDGKSLIFTSNRGGSAQLYRLELASGEINRLSFEGKFNARARIFPDGKRIAYIHKDAGSASYSVVVQHLDTGRLRVLASDGFQDAPGVSPNGRMLIYSVKVNERTELGIVSVDGRVSFRLPFSEGDVREPAWSPYLH